MSNLNKNHLKFNLILLISTFVCMRAHAEASEKYQFNASPECQLKKYVNHEWRETTPDEVSTEGVVLHPAKGNASHSNFYDHHTWYSAPTSCFTAMNSSPPPLESPLENKENPSHSTVLDTEILHQAASGAFEVTPSFLYEVVNTTYQPGLTSTSLKEASITTGALLEYGFSNSFSLGLNLQYQNQTITTVPAGTSSPNSSGLMDPQLDFNGRFNLGALTLRATLEASTALSHHVIQSNGNSNQASGQTVLNPMLGLELPIENSIIGLFANYQVYKSDATVDTQSSSATTTSKTQGGKIFTSSLFYEYHLDQIWFGAAFNYSSLASTTTVSASGTSTNNNDSASFLGGTLYGHFQLNNLLTLVPQFSYSKISYAPSVAALIASSSDISLGLAARLKFY